MGVNNHQPTAEEGYSRAPLPDSGTGRSDPVLPKATPARVTYALVSSSQPSESESEPELESDTSMATRRARIEATSCSGLVSSRRFSSTSTLRSLMPTEQTHTIVDSFHLPKVAPGVRY